MRVLAGDIGGTNTRLAIIDIGERGFRIIHSRRYRSRDVPALGPAILSFLDETCGETGERPERACVGVAGPVHDGHSTLTNLSWTIDAPALATAIGIPRTALVNDLVAAACGVQQLAPQDMVTLNAGAIESPAPGTLAIIAAGTGLGEAYVTWESDHHSTHSSEGGHTTFAARTEEEWRLAQFLREQRDEVSYERVVSGRGLADIYRYMCGGESDPVRHERLAALESADVAPAHVTGLALADGDPLAVEALAMFMSAYGSAAGNLALTVMATGGVYIAGGIAPRIVNELANGTFMRAFLDNGRMSSMLARIPVQVVINRDVGLVGAGVLAARL